MFTHENRNAKHPVNSVYENAAANSSTVKREAEQKAGEVQAVAQDAAEIAQVSPLFKSII